MAILSNLEEKELELRRSFDEVSDKITETNTQIRKLQQTLSGLYEERIKIMGAFRLLTSFEKEAGKENIAPLEDKLNQKQ